MKILFQNPTFKNNKSQASFKGISLQSLGNVKNLEKCDDLFVLAHPDDEVCFFSFITNLLKNRRNVQLIYATPGQNGRDIRGLIKRYDPQIAIERKKELISALNKIHLKRDPVMLDMMDGSLHTQESKLVLDDLFVSILKQTVPENVYSFGPDGITSHSDHKALSNLFSDSVKAALLQSKVKILSFLRVGLTTAAQKELIAETQGTTHMFSRAVPSDLEPLLNTEFNIRENIPQIVDAYTQYKTQFPQEAVQPIENYLYRNPVITLNEQKIFV